MLGWFQRILERLSGFLGQGWFRSLIQGLGFIWVSGGYHALNDLLPGVSIESMRRLTALAVAPDEVIAGVLSGFLEVLTGVPIRLDDITEQGIGIGSKSGMEAMGERFLTPMLNLILPDVEPGGAGRRLPPSAGFSAANRFLATNLEFQLSAWFLHFLADIKSFGVFKSIKDLPNAISWSYGIGWLSWLVMGVPFRMGISEPMEEGYNRIYRPKRLTPAQLWSARHAGMISQETYLDELRSLGYPEDLIPLIRVETRKKFSQSMLKALLEDGFVSKEYIRSAILDDGFEGEMASLTTDQLANDRLTSWLKKVADVAGDLYEDGLVDQTTFQGYLNRAYYNGKESQTIIMFHDLKKQLAGAPQPTEKRLTPANVGRLYQLGKITKQDSTLRLLGLNYVASEVDMFLELYAPEKPKSPETPELTASVIGGLYKRREISDIEAETLFTDLKYSSEDIVLLLRFYKPIAPPVPRPVEILTASAVGRLFKMEEITLEDAINRLIERGATREDAILFLTLYTPPQA